MSQTIPFVKPVRVGNYKLWRGRFAINSGSDKTDIACIHISNLDGSWMVRIPSTMALYGVIMDGYAMDDEKQRDLFLRTVFDNIYSLGTSSSVFLHDAFSFVIQMVSSPYLLLPEKEMVKRMKANLKKDGLDKKKAEALISDMCGYRTQLYELLDKKIGMLIDDYEMSLELQREDEETAQKLLDQDEKAMQAMSIVNEEKPQ